MNPTKALWTERYRPSTLSELILPKRISDKLSNGLYQNILLYGNCGSGKTSAAKILVKDNPHLYINCSTESSIDILRTKIVEFCSSLSVLDGQKKLKFVIFDEIDGVSSDQFFKGLRGEIERFANTARFIATCNYINKVPDNIQSRFECISFDFDQDESLEIEKKYILRVYEILKKEGIAVEKEALLELVKRKFPDMRSIVNTLQGFHAEGKTKVTLSDITKFHGVHKDLFDFLFMNKTEVENYQYIVSNYSNRVDDAITALGQDFLEYIKLEKPLMYHKIGEICYEVNKHSYELRFVIDPVITLLSLVYKLQMIIKK